MANIISIFISPEDMNSFQNSRSKEQAALRDVEFQLSSMSIMMGETLSWRKGREFTKNSVISSDKKEIFYRIVPGVDDTRHCFGDFTLLELQKLMNGEGPAVKGTPEQRALEAALRSNRPECCY